MADYVQVFLPTFTHYPDPMALPQQLRELEILASYTDDPDAVVFNYNVAGVFVTTELARMLHDALAAGGPIDIHVEAKDTNFIEAASLRIIGIGHDDVTLLMHDYEVVAGQTMSEHVDVNRAALGSALAASIEHLSAAAAAAV